MKSNLNCHPEENLCYKRCIDFIGGKWEFTDLIQNIYTAYTQKIVGNNYQKKASTFTRRVKIIYVHCHIIMHKSIKYLSCIKFEYFFKDYFQEYLFQEYLCLLKVFVLLFVEFLCV